MIFVRSTGGEIEIEGIKILLTQKRIRNLHLRISAPEGEVKVSAPLRYSLAKIEEFILQKIDWIKSSRARIWKLRDEGKIKMPSKLISGEEHYLFGEKFRLEVIKNSDRNKVTLSLSKSDSSSSCFDGLSMTAGEGSVIELRVKGQSNLVQRQKLLDDFYRKHLKAVIPELIEKYEKKMGVKVAEFGVKKMKTRWGTCNVRARRIWLSLELAKKPHGFLESTVVHEMVHLLESGHNRRFYELMDRFMPEWRVWDKKKP